ncbi:MAG: GNAT family N-acetyltransferase [Caldilineaceae bacterium]|nr:GNAT family N-acetyltransferase [Caldilineaceae bacterium]
MELRNIRLAEAATLSIRPAQPSDTPLIAAMHERLSPTTLYLRYLRPYRPSPEEIEQMCRLSPTQGAAAVAVVERPSVAAPPQVVGFAYYLVDAATNSAGEPAFLVEDRFQGYGLGRLLFQQLSRLALAQGLLRWRLLVEAGNERMLRLIRHSGLPYQSHISYGTVEIDLMLN